MRVAIDAVGRLVVPKPLRDELGIGGPTELELTARDGVLELAVADVDARLEERDGTPVMIAPDTSVVIAAAAAWHESHDAAVAALDRPGVRLIGHVGFETTAALSRMP